MTIGWLLSACSLQPVHHAHLLWLETEPAQKQALTLDTQLIILPVQVPSSLATQDLAYRNTGQEIAYFATYQWANPLPEAIQILLTQYLSQTGRWRAVSRAQVGLNNPWQLDTQVYAWWFDYQDLQNPHFYIQLNANLVDQQGHIHQQWPWQIRVPLTQLGPQALAPELKQALTQWLQSLEQQLQIFFTQQKISINKH
ncbi:ABC-type transport auxiliary lipoprotein family protein [Allopseudospirillum japonicum]|uniref:ABC-type transport auxiliary lipoprotein family protein n=1 Tax=Allopseudospirillum japonicum TaxID=64971 RepID=UPI0015A665BC|nr:ABC-type transport auxiliary lipoprotein family protein [Allopseudospirillum japonicum]